VTSGVTVSRSARSKSGRKKSAASPGAGAPEEPCGEADPEEELGAGLGTGGPRAGGGLLSLLVARLSGGAAATAFRRLGRASAGAATWLPHPLEAHADAVPPDSCATGVDPPPPIIWRSV
jgi:hypothetical protein